MEDKITLYEALRIKLIADVMIYPNDPGGEYYTIPLSEEFLYAGYNDKKLRVLARYLGGIGKFRICTAEDKMTYVEFKDKYYIQKVSSSAGVVGVLEKGSNYSIVALYNSQGVVREYAVAWKMIIENGRCDWEQGYYCNTLEDAVSIYIDKIR